MTDIFYRFYCDPPERPDQHEPHVPDCDVAEVRAFIKAAEGYITMEVPVSLETRICREENSFEL